MNTEHASSFFESFRLRVLGMLTIGALVATAVVSTVAGAAAAADPAATSDAGPAPTALTVGTLTEPVDVENLTAPLLGWNVGAGMQSAYEIQVASTADGVASADVWDSGRVTSTANANVPYAGPALAASSGYFWRVRTWDATGAASAWSSTAHFGTGPGGTWSGATPIWTTAVPGLSASDFTYTGTFTISTVAASINFRERDTNNFYMWQFRTDGTLKEHKNVGGTFTVLATPTLPVTPVAGTAYDFKIVASGAAISTWIRAHGSADWLSAGTLNDSTFSSGALGFRTGSTETFSATNLVLTDASGTVLYRNDFSDAANTDFSACGTISSSARNVGLSKNCIYSGGGSTSNNWAFLRGDVDLPAKTLAWAHLYVAASSTSPARQFVAKTSINGTVVGVGPSRPVGSETRYDGYDVAGLLRTGTTNTVSALAYTTSGQQYEALLVVRYSDGSSQTFGTGTGWKALNGSGVLPDGGSIGTSYYTAPKENYQAAKFPFGYDRPGFDDSAWPAATARPAFSSLVATPDAKVQQLLKSPVKVVEYSPGNYFIDYGRTWIGGVSLDLQGKAGQVVDIRYGEVTSAANTVKYQTSAGNSYEDLWTLRAGDNPLETWGPRVFRYVNVLGAPTGLSASDFSANAYVYPFDTTLSQFDSSNANLDSVWQLSKNTVEALNLNGYVDSYERERGFYEADDYIQLMSNLSTGGDATLGTYSTLYLLSNRTWPTEWPFYVILSLHDTYLATGDATNLSAFYSQLQSKLPDKWYDAASGMIKKTTGTSCSSSTDCDIVDWPAGDRDGFVFSPFNTVINAISYRAYTDMADIATALGKTADAATYTARAATIKAGLNSVMWNAGTGAYSDGSTDGVTPIAHYAVQSSAFAVAMGAATPQNAQGAAAYLGSRGMACSVYCADFMVQAAFTGGNGEVGAGFLASTATNSWMAMIAQGAGATMEAWNPADKSNLTYSHPWSSSPASNIPQYLFGIQPTTAGYRTFQVAPQPSSVATWAHITVPSPNGKIGAAYDTQGDRTDVGVWVPGNSTASVSVPSSDSAATVYVDGIAHAATATAGYLRVDDVAPGCHVFTTDAGGAAYSDAHLTAVCPAGYQADQKIAFDAPADHTLGDADFAVSATATSGLPVALDATGSCTITGALVHLTGAGDCTVTATQAGDVTYRAAAPVAHTFAVARGAAVVSADPVSTAWGTAAAVTVRVTSTAAAVSGQVRLSEGSTDRGSAALAGGAVTFRLPVGLSAGIHTLTADYLGSDDLAPASTTVTVTVVLPTAWNASTAYPTGATVSMNGQVYTAAWATKGEQPGKTATGAWQQMSMTEDGTAIWTASRIFHTGDRVDDHGRIFEAAWYSRGDAPGSVTGPWEEIATAPDGTAIWTASRIFNTGDVVVYNGQKYTARWYTRNQVPGTPNGAWK